MVDDKIRTFIFGPQLDIRPLCASLVSITVSAPYSDPFMQCARPLREKYHESKKEHNFGLEHRTVTKITFLKRREKFQSTHTSLDRKYCPAEKFSKSAEAEFLGSFKCHF